ncbi:MAG: DUF3786 domain-containing protein [Desulfamplus sp.]|nr:DUF3786 domain-containing protein [Desulfamplus sp.]
MALSIVDLYKKVLPKTNCKECSFLTCLAFAGMVVSEKHPLRGCPHIASDVLEWAEKELEEQYRQGKWLKKDMAVEALQLAKDKITKEDLKQIGDRIGGKMEGDVLVLPYFNTYLYIDSSGVKDEAGNDLSRNEQTFVYIHISMMIKAEAVTPTGNLKSFKEFPNTVAKVVSMRNHIEEPLKKAFAGNLEGLKRACLQCGGIDVKDNYESPNLALSFQVFPLVAVTLLFWEAGEEFDADVKLLFDEKVTCHLDIESIMFLSQYLADRLRAASIL